MRPALKVKDDLIQEKNAQIADKDELIDKLHEDISSSRAQRLKLTSAAFIQSLVVIALLAALVAYIGFDIAGGGFRDRRGLICQKAQHKSSPPSSSSPRGAYHASVYSHTDATANVDTSPLYELRL